MPDQVQREESTGLFPIRWPVTLRGDRTPRIVEIGAEEATEVFDALSSETARALIHQIHDSPQTASELAETTDTSVQNVQYHLQKFEEADLVEVVDTWISSRGAEMNVYGPVDRSLVLYTGTHPGNAPLGEVLGRLLGGVGVLGIASLLIDRFAWMFTSPAPATGDAPARELPNQVEPLMFEVGGVTFSPGLLFFVAGLSVLTIATIWWYRQS